MERRVRALFVSALLLLSTAHAAEPASAQRLAQDAVIVDTHIDAPTGLRAHWDDLGVATSGKDFDYPRARQGGLDVAFMSIFTSAGDDDAGKAWQIAHTQIDAVEALAARHPDKFALLRAPGDIERLRAGGRVLMAMGMENGAPIGDDLAQLAKFHARGVRYITLAHSANNRISDASYALEKQWGGLSPFGEQVVAEMNRLGTMVDVSHLSDDAVRDVLRITDVPVIASHSGLRHFTPGFERNLSDELARAIAAEGGVVQLVFGNAFIDAQSAANVQAYYRAQADLLRAIVEAAAAGKPTRDMEAFEKAWEVAHPAATTHIDAVLDQVDHAVKLMGIDHVGIGSDFDGVGGELPVELRSVADYPHFVAGLQARGYADADIRKILGGNLLRVWTAVEAAAQAR
jgi:membrane dipeptidase